MATMAITEVTMAGPAMAVDGNIMAAATAATAATADGVIGAVDTATADIEPAAGAAAIRGVGKGRGK